MAARCGGRSGFAAVADKLTRAEDAYRAYHAQIYAFLLRKTGDPVEAEELTQQVFADVVAALSRKETAPRSFRGWLYAVADRRFADELRRRSHAAEISALRLPRQTPKEYEPSIAREVKDAIGALSNEQRQLVVMKVLEGRPFAEMAERLGISEGACKMRFSRAIKHVRQRLEDKEIEP